MDDSEVAYHLSDIIYDCDFHYPECLGKMSCIKRTVAKVDFENENYRKLCDARSVIKNSTIHQS